MRLTTRIGGRPSRRTINALARFWGLPAPVVKDALTSDYGVWMARGGKMPHAVEVLREAWYGGDCHDNRIAKQESGLT